MQLTLNQNLQHTENTIQIHNHALKIKSRVLDYEPWNLKKCQKNLYTHQMKTSKMI